MIFSELYSAYYQAVATILKEACTHPVQVSELRKIIDQIAFGESVLNIEPALLEERWQLIRQDGTTPIQHAPSMPLTTLQKRWLKSIFLDPRIRLFYDNPPDYPDVNPLFTADDIRVFDKYLDGDPFEDADYIRNFRMILDAIKTRTPLNIDSMNRKGNTVRCTLMPEYLEYSEKDDKIRLIGSGCRYGGIINLARIVQCTPSARKFKYKPDKEIQIDHRTVELEVIDHRNALERVLMHFAHFEKQAEKIDQNRYKVLITYDNDDETEILIRILSFGPMVKVVAPKHFVDLIKERLIQQKSCGQ